MASRQQKPRRPFQDNNPNNGSNRRTQGAWNRNNGSFANAARQNSGGFPPLGRQEAGYDAKLLASLTSQINNTIVLVLKSGTRHQGTVHSLTQDGDSPGVTLKDVRDPNNPSLPVKDTLFLSANTLSSWNPAPKTLNGVGHDSFRTDTDISGQNPAARRERELQQWQPDSSVPDPSAQTDEDAFGPLGKYTRTAWDQFEENETKFGLTTNYTDEMYTTKLDRSAPGFEERERRAQQIADEIMNSNTSNPHIAEERQMNGVENGIGEEEKYSAVVRGANAYVPPGARKNNSGALAPATNGSTPTSATPNNPVTAAPAPASAASPSPKPTTAETATANANANANTTGSKPADGLVGSFRAFVTDERQRVTQRKQAMVKSEMDKRKADLLKFSKSFKLNRPIPEDLIPILTKDEQKQKELVEKAKADAASATTTRPAASPSSQNSVAATPVAKDTSAVKQPKPTTTSPPESQTKKTSMYIQPIPPFDKNKAKARAAAAAAATGSSTGTPAPAATPGTSASAAVSPSAPRSPATINAATTNNNNNAFRLNVNASSFRPNPLASTFKPISPVAPPVAKTNSKDDAAPPANTGNNNSTPPNPFFGARMPTKKGAAVHLKDDFNPFRHAKVADASAVNVIWSYQGKKHSAMFPPIPTTQQPPHHPPVAPGPPAPPQGFEEDAAQQAAQAQRQPYPMMYYPQYPYAPPMQGHGQQPMMMPPTAPGFIPGYMHVPYSAHMPPTPALYGAPPPGMQGVPPPPHHPYMAPPPPGAYQPTSPPPNGTPRGPGMPGTPMAPPPPHGYYPSPPMGHAMPYPMMVPQPGQPGPPPPHFDPNQGPPGAAQPPMGGVPGH